MKSVLIFAFLALLQIHESLTIPLHPEDDPIAVQQEYDHLKRTLVTDYGYTKEFADMVETNLKRAITEEQERQLSNIIDPFDLSTSTSTPLRQNPNQGSDEYDDDTTQPTTPRASPGDIVRGIAQLVSGLGTFNLNTFWGSFVNFFPPGQREQAQALVDGALGRRPQQWPTMPTTTTKAPTTERDYDLESDETTRPAVAAVTATSALGGAGATLAPVGSATVSTQQVAATTIVTYFIPGSENPPTPATPPPFPPTRVPTASARDDEDSGEETKISNAAVTSATELDIEIIETETDGPEPVPVPAQVAALNIKEYIPGSEVPLVVIPAPTSPPAATRAPTSSPTRTTTLPPCRASASPTSRAKASPSTRAPTTKYSVRRKVVTQPPVEEGSLPPIEVEDDDLEISRSR